MGMFNAKENNPVEILKKDHEKVKEIFEEFENTEEPEEKERLVKEAITELKIHTTVEEEIFYPTVREELKEEEEEIDETMDEAVEEHHAVDLLIKELEGMSPDEERYDAKFIVLSEMVKHHIEEEENEIFPKIKGSEESWQEIGEEMMQRKEELQSEFSQPSSRSESRKSHSSGGTRSAGSKAKKARKTQSGRGRAKSHR